MKESYFESCDEPLCTFCVSAAFFIRGVSSEKGQTAPSGRQQLPFSIPSYCGLRIGRISRNKSNLLLTIADLFSNFKRRKYLTLEEILATVQNVWKAPESLTFRGSDSDMEKSYSRSSVKETGSPVTQRRRLSVPETVMRKHNLALEQSTSFQESKHFHWDKEVACSSDPNLNRKKDFNIMRKSTLLRRLWGDTSKPKLSGSFQEWQHSYKKLSSTQSLNSSHSSPEHMPRKFDHTSPRRKFSSSPNRFSSKSFNEDQNIFNSPKRKTPVIHNASLKTLPKTPLSRDSTTKYTGSSFTNVSDTNSDSAYSNSISNFTSSVSSRPNTKRNQPDENCNRCSSRLQERAVQTKEVTNLNVISNVSLSQATLDVIFKEVMKDVGRIAPGDININTATVTTDELTGVKVDQAPSFFLDMNASDISSSDSPPRLDKFIISKVRTGSPYTKPAEPCQPAIPRFSAVPRTSSMEVNTSEEDKEESDAVSFVDSLEDFSSPRATSNSRRSSADVAQLLPEGKKTYTPKKSSTFFIPIQVDNEREAKAVSELLPLRVRERLNERQQKREEKSRQVKSFVQPTTTNVSVIKSTLNFGNNLPKRRTKPILPSIASLKRSSSKERSEPSQTRRKNEKSTNSKERKLERLPLERGNGSSVNPNQSALRHESPHKRIEILEIMECADVSQDRNKKSKIPILVNSNASKKTEFDKPTYLDLDNQASDPKMDQLIANILIDSLNHDTETARYQDLENDNLAGDTSPKRNDNKYIQKFDIIPEESHKHHETVRDTSIKDPNKNRTNPENNINLRQKNLSSSIPKGWVTVYTVHKDLETPESTSDEGKKCSMGTKEATDGAADAVRDRRCSEKNVTRDISHFDYQNERFIAPNRCENPTFGSTLFHNSLNKFDSFQRKSSGRRENQQQKSLGDWSVTISGSNSYGQMAPDLEMRLKFPKKYRTSSNSDVGKENNQNSKCNFPKIDNEQNLPDFDRRRLNGKQRIHESLPKINTAHNKINKREGSVISMTHSVLIPRQTKTSTSRYHFSRPRERYSLPDVPSILNDRQYFEIIKRIPNILAVTGRSISPERRSFEEG